MEQLKHTVGLVNKTCMKCEKKFLGGIAATACFMCARTEDERRATSHQGLVDALKTIAASETTVEAGGKTVILTRNKEIAECALAAAGEEVG